MRAKISLLEPVYHDPYNRHVSHYQSKVVVEIENQVLSYAVTASRLQALELQGDTQDFKRYITRQLQNEIMKAISVKLFGDE